MRIDVWYDRHTRSWVVQVKDKCGNQVGDATYVYTKPEALAVAESLKKNMGLNKGGITMTLFEVREGYINERLKLWNKMQNTPSPTEYNQLAVQYNDLCASYKEFLLVNDLNEIE